MKIPTILNHAGRRTHLLTHKGSLTPPASPPASGMAPTGTSGPDSLGTVEDPAEWDKKSPEMSGLSADLSGMGKLYN